MIGIGRPYHWTSLATSLTAKRCVIKKTRSDLAHRGETQSDGKQHGRYILYPEFLALQTVPARKINSLFLLPQSSRPCFV
jgi:hypothetical protein